MTGHGQELVVVVVVVEGPQRRPEKSSAQLLRRELLLTVKHSAPGKMRGFPTSKSETTPNLPYAGNSECPGTFFFLKRSTSPATLPSRASQ